jgi:5-formyltetrahydrofolate cyclo-ligase
MPEVDLKKQLRVIYLERRGNLPAAERASRSEAVRGRLESADFFSSARCLFLYAAIRTEVATSRLADMALQAGRRLGFPRYQKDGGLLFHQVDRLSDLASGAFGVPEPGAGPEISLAEADVVLVPGLAFDRRGYRLGYGGGAYDRALKGVRSLKVGLAFDFQVSEEDLPAEDFDVPMDYVVTDRRLLDCRHSPRSST